MNLSKLAATQLKSVATGELKENGVRLVGVGLEELGVEEFVEGQYFSGDLFIDLKQESYKEINMKRHSYFSIWPSVFGKKGRDATSRAKSMSISGNLKGDGFLMGGTIVVNKGGTETLLQFKQDGPADHVENSAILKALGISGGDAASPPPAADGDKPKVTCTEDVCTRS
ncbi:Prostamide/prostaglandin F synthase [Amphibalanus amphitrite]|uniref:Prostamide/prostaglandin F synthase n=1 Tax=Amphibalanus amphitrite TaxID=1232801 RepID=A0A6A4VPL7_AMPAM|nr:Prostamide/prostaglandin F synthase [Amphibalanus amphitrite]